MEKVVIAVLLIVLLAVWMISVRQKLAAVNENINNAMNQIGVQLDVCFDMLMPLIELTGVHAARERETLEKLAVAGRREITAKSTPEEVLGQGFLSLLNNPIFSSSCFIHFCFHYLLSLMPPDIHAA